MIRFFLPGTPVAKARARSTSNGRHYTPEKTREYERRIAAKAKQAMSSQGFAPLTEPVDLELMIWQEIPRSWPEWKRQAALRADIAPTTKPDASNVLKSVEDACNGIVWMDDCQITHCKIICRYDSEPGIYVTVKRAPGIAAQIAVNLLTMAEQTEASEG